MFNFSKKFENPSVIPDKKETLVEKNEIKNPEIEALRGPLKEVLCQIGSKFETGEYDVIIGDDVSGRVVSLALGNIINNIYKEHGYKKLEHLFLAGQGRGGDQQKKRTNNVGKHLDNVFQQRGLNKPKRILVVTDTIETGNSLTPLTKYLTSQGIVYDIVTMSFHERTGGGISDLEEDLGGNIYGSLNNSVHHSIYGKRNLAGVQKDVGDVLSHRHEEYDAKEVREARGDIKLLSEDLIAEYKNKKRSEIDSSAKNNNVESILDPYFDGNIINLKAIAGIPKSIHEINLLNTAKQKINNFEEARPIEAFIIERVIRDYVRHTKYLIDKLNSEHLLVKENEGAMLRYIEEINNKKNNFVSRLKDIERLESLMK